MKGYNISGDCLYPGGEKEALRRMKEKVSQVETLFVNSYHLQKSVNIIL